MSIKCKPLATLTITSPFGNRIDPINGKKDYHSGVDFGAPQGTKVFAVQDGTISVGENASAGKYIILKQGVDKFKFYHLSAIYVKDKQKVSAGTIIGAVGKTGRVTGSHLHYEHCINNVAVDPMEDINALLPEGVTRKKIQVNGVLKEVKATMIDEENYCNLRDIADALGYKVDYNATLKLPILKK